MQYDKFLISLCKIGEQKPSLFVGFNKRADKIYIKIEPDLKEEGYLFLYSQNIYSYFNFKKGELEFVLNDRFDFESSYFLLCEIKDNSYIGKRGSFENDFKIIQNFKKIKKQIETKNNINQELKTDIHNTVDIMMNKMFGYTSLAYFECSMVYLTNLFNHYERETELEKIIPYSKFVRVGNKGDEFYVGIVYKDNKPYAIGIGGIGEMKDDLTDICKCQYFYRNDKVEEKNAGFYLLTFRKVSDGDIVWINLTS